MASVIKLNLHALLEFFDEGVISSQGHATAINAVLGEEIAIGLMADYFTSNGRKVEVKYPCTQGTQKGVRLDCWIRVDNEIYQVEIKNWSSHSVGGRVFPKKEDAVEQYLIERWRNQWLEEKKIPRDKAARKVLVPMKLPNEWEHHKDFKTMLCFWDPMHPEGRSEPLFSVPTADGCPFQQLFVFSLSIYVRNLLRDRVSEKEVSMPNVTARMAWLNKICQQ